MRDLLFTLEVFIYLDIVTPVQELKKNFLLTESEFSEQDVKDIKEGNKWLMTLTADRIKEID
jgi:hypothetical protein